MQFDECFLSEQEFNGLNKGDRIDYRDYEGRFLKTIVLKVADKAVFIKYEEYPDSYNVWAIYEEDPYRFAKYRSISCRFASSSIRDYGVGDPVLFKPNKDGNSKWRRGIITDFDRDSYKKICSGQVAVKYKDDFGGIQWQYTHLDNDKEIGAVPTNKNVQQQQQVTYSQQNGDFSSNPHYKNNKNNNNNNNNNNNKNMINKQQPKPQFGLNDVTYGSQQRSVQNNNNYNNNNNNNKTYGRSRAQNNKNNKNNKNVYDDDDFLINEQEYQSNHGGDGKRRGQRQKQEQKQRLDQMTVRTQLLLDDTNHQLQLTRDYLNAVNDKKATKQDLSVKNRKVVSGLTLFEMKVEGMRESKEEGLDFSDAFKSSAMIIKQFEEEYKAEFGSNEVLMQRLEPCLNYMRAALMGKTDIPPLPYINNSEFTKQTANSVMGKFQAAVSHFLPNRMKEINENSKEYKSKQKELKQRYEDEQHKENVTDINYKHLIQDFDGDIKFAKSKEEQNKEINEMMNKYKYQEPDFVNGSGDDAMDCDKDNDNDNDNVNGNNNDNHYYDNQHDHHHHHSNNHQGNNGHNGHQNWQ